MGQLPKYGEVEATTAASPEAVWAIVSDPTRVGEWSHECQGADWVNGATEATPGARFRGRNRLEKAKWTRTNEVVSIVPPRQLSWRTIPSTLYPDSTIWTIEVEPAPGGTRIVQRFEVVKLNPLVGWIFYTLIPRHRDRSAALTEDLRQLGAVAERAERTAQSR
jgi:uncharacterized protein YndB with AHSA1/START domain